MAADALSPSRDNCATISRPNGSHPRPAAALAADCGHDDRLAEALLIASTSCQARRYDMPIARAAAEIEPVESIAQ